MKQFPRKIIKGCRKVNKFIKRHLINGTKGVISLFLAILMVPFATIAGALVNAARINSAVAIFDEALCNASNSTLGTYEEFLRERFGLLAMAQNTSGEGGSYTVENLISDTFKKYMEMNLGTLSNTYVSTELDAAGVYPLADTDVLLSQVYESGKYLVPTKLVVDGLCLEDILNSLTDSMGMVTSIFDTLSAGSNMVTSLTDCEIKFNSLKDELDKLATAETTYDSAYDEFNSAVNAYNSLIDEMNRKIRSAENRVSNAESSLSSCDSTYESEKAKVQGILDEIEAIENEKDAAGNPVDNSERIAEIKEEHKEELKAYNDAEKALDNAKTELTNADSSLSSIKNSYATRISEKKTTVETEKREYVAAIDGLADAVLASGNAVTAAQSSVASAINSGVQLVSSVGSTIAESQKQATSKQKEDLKKNRTTAKEKGDNDALSQIDKQLEEIEKQSLTSSNENKVEKAYLSATKDYTSSLNDFIVEDYNTLYGDLYSEIVNFKNEVNGFSIPTDSIKMSSAKYKNFDLLLDSQDVLDLQDGIAGEIASSAFLSTLKALVGFIKALFDISLSFDPDLIATIDEGYYKDSIGGLPSKKDRTDPRYSLKSDYAEIDKAKSDDYKELLGEYSSNKGVAGSVNTLDSIVDSIMTDIDTIKSSAEGEWKWSNIWTKLKSLVSAAASLAGHLVDLAKDIVNSFLTSVYQKILLSGYIAYNTANRTTFEGQALTGASYNLPTATSEKQGYAFYGAETEYILNGSTSEIDNQEAVCTTIYIIRLVYDVLFIACNQEVATIAGEAGAATFGIGTVVVYLLYILAEPLVDTLILVNGGTVPIIKTKLYLTPSGITDLIGAFYHLGLSEEEKNEAYKGVVDVMGAGNTSESFSQNYADAVSGFKEDSSDSLSEMLTFDYTKTLVLIMMFKSPNTMIERLADVIQMECTYDVKTKINSYDFDLDKSFTYLRASGKFSSNEFIKISESSVLNSTERVVYRGY